MVLLGQGEIYDDLLFEFLGACYLILHVLLQGIDQLATYLLLFIVYFVPVLARLDLLMFFLVLLYLQLHKLFLLLFRLTVLLLAVLSYFSQAFTKIVMELADFFDVVGDFPDGLLD